MTPAQVSILRELLFLRESELGKAKHLSHDYVSTQLSSDELGDLIGRGFISRAHGRVVRRFVVDWQRMYRITKKGIKALETQTTNNQ